MSDVERLAEEHSEWYARLCKRVYKEAFLHGFKHGKQAVEKK